MAIDHIALRVAEFCNATPVRSAGSWEAWLDIDQGLVAQTTLFCGFRRTSYRFASIPVRRTRASYFGAEGSVWRLH